MTVPLYNLTDAWNNALTAFDAIKMNVTDTGHAAASTLINLQIGGSTLFSVSPTGAITALNFTSGAQGLAPASGGGTTNFLRADGTWAAPAYPTGANPTATAGDVAVNGSAATFMRSDGAPAVQKTSASVFGLCKVDGTTITATGGVITATGGGGGGSPGGSSGNIQYNNSGAFGGFGTWDGSAVMALVNSTTAQELDIYSTFTSSSAFRKMEILTGQTFVDDGQTFTNATILTSLSKSGGVAIDSDPIFIIHPPDSRAGNVGGVFGYNPLDVAFTFRATNSSGVENAWAPVFMGALTCRALTVLGGNVVDMMTPGPEMSLQPYSWNNHPGLIFAGRTASNTQPAGGCWWTSNTNADSGTVDAGLVRTASANILEINQGVWVASGGSYGHLKLGDLYTNDASFLIRTGTTLNNGAGTGSGVTFTNAPGASGATGNPTKWIPIDDNGTTRYIPAF